MGDVVRMASVRSYRDRVMESIERRIELALRRHVPCEVTIEAVDRVIQDVTEELIQVFPHMGKSHTEMTILVSDVVLERFAVQIERSK